MSRKGEKQKIKLSGRKKKKTSFLQAQPNVLPRSETFFLKLTEKNNVRKETKKNLRKKNTK